MKKRALVSVSDKSGILEFAQELEKMDYQILSTGGTKRFLEENGMRPTAVFDVLPKLWPDRRCSLLRSCCRLEISLPANFPHRLAA